MAESFADNAALRALLTKARTHMAAAEAAEDDERDVERHLHRLVATAKAIEQLLIGSAWERSQDSFSQSVAQCARNAASAAGFTAAWPPLSISRSATSTLDGSLPDPKGKDLSPPMEAPPEMPRDSDASP